MANVAEKYEVRNRCTNAVQFTADIMCHPDASISIKLGLAVRWAKNNGVDLRGVDLRDADLRGVDLRGVDLWGVDLSDADLSDADLRGVDLRGVDLRGVYLSDADLSDADLRGVNLRGVDLCGVDLRGVDLRGVYLRGVDLSDADLRGVDLRGVDLCGVDLRGVDLSDADLRGVNLLDADLRGVYLSDADLSAFKADFWMILHGARAEITGLIAALKDGRVDGSTYHGDCACLVGTIANIRHVSVDTLEVDSSRPAEQWFLMIKKGDKPGDDTGGGFATSKALEWAHEYCDLAGIEIQEEDA